MTVTCTADAEVEADAIRRQALERRIVAQRRNEAVRARRPAGDAPRLAGYRILHELGRGGMGVVWLAERQVGDAVQKVALKQISHGDWDAEALRRFQRERRILAALEHPHIAALVDGGTDVQGRAFLATQYIDGERLDHWQRRQRPDPATFQAQCRAAHAARECRFVAPGA